MAVQGLASVGTIAGFITYTAQFGRPLNTIATLYNTIQAAIAGAERVFETLDESEEVDAPDAEPPGEMAGDVVFERVGFGYEPDRPVLADVSLHAAPGQVVALVGPTGAGKTTIVNLLTRFYEVDEGRILIDGRDIRRLEKAELRRRLGIVLQDTFLFAETVSDNIRYGRLDATDAEVIAAAELANADAFIHRLPQGYQTLLSERGANLSQGQRQLLAIARAILADPRILILDEATSSVDTRTEQHIQEAMRRLMAGRTSFVIAHRLSTIREADQILVVDRGRIVERGTHASLLAHGGVYRHLYASQFRARLRPSAPGEDPAAAGPSSASPGRLRLTAFLGTAPGRTSRPAPSRDGGRLTSAVSSNGRTATQGSHLSVQTATQVPSGPSGPASPGAGTSPSYPTARRDPCRQEGGAQKGVPRRGCQKGVPRRGCPEGGAQKGVPRRGCPEGGARIVAARRRAMALGPAEIELFHEQGFLIVQNVLTADELETMRVRGRADRPGRAPRRLSYQAAGRAGRRSGRAGRPELRALAAEDDRHRPGP
jgi:ABC-type multidrug transport system ATPase subunit